MKLAGKVILVTGGARGMGENHVRRLLAEGARVAFSDVDVARGEQLAAALGREVRFFPHDVRREEDWKRVIEETCQVFGGLDGLVNNAGILSRGSILEETLDSLRAVYEVNVFGAWLGIRAAVPVLEARGGGSIVNVASQVAVRGWVDYSVYGSSKWAIRGLTRHLALELAAKGIRVNAVLPGAVVGTGLLDGRLDEERLEAVRRSIPLGRFVTRDEVSSLVIHLLSDEAASITGSELLIDGGASI
ncbi:MAG: oxidoreductase [Porticoccaceae bacterium]|nr:MAG: oxidoreductase [Porticoccaceae bacterium]